MPSQTRRWKNLGRKLLVNWRYKLAALAAAFIIWTYVAGQQSMQAVYTVPIFFQNIPAGSEMVRQAVDTIQVTISGRRDRILSLKERQIWAAIDLGGMKIGKNRYQLTKQDFVAPAGIEVKAFTPTKLSIRLSKIKPPTTEPAP